jgi:hypothetical protein
MGDVLPAQQAVSGRHISGSPSQAKSAGVFVLMTISAAPCAGSARRPG